MTPTRKVVGLEDPWLRVHSPTCSVGTRACSLRTAAAPNYFEAAAARIDIISTLILEL
jgi:hypothetical protein